jgi:Na+/glutamate symporter
MDSILVQSQSLQFACPYPLPGLAPVWIMALWLGFALTLNHSLRSIYAKALPTFLFGLLGGPVAYGIATMRFEAMSVQGSTLECALWIGLVWGIGLSVIRWLDLRSTSTEKGQTA